jgi:predicted nucleotidyltransferase
MKENLLDLSEKIDGFMIGLFEAIADITESLSIPFFVVGAAARDMILTEYYGIETGLATKDVDLAAYVSDWVSYEQLREGLIGTGKFERKEKVAQRLLYEKRYPVDIIPFGAITEPSDGLSWPPEHDTRMSTLGFEEAYHNTITVRMRAEPALDIVFVSLPGLALLKMISWNDNPPARGPDARDLLLLMRTYLDAGNQERLWNEEKDLVGENFDYVRAGSRLLGRDIAKILSPNTKKAVLKILDKETGEQSHYRLVANMMNSRIERINFEDVLQLLEDLKTGILERI